MKVDYLTLVCGLIVCQMTQVSRGAEPTVPGREGQNLTDLVGQPADIAPSAYLYRSDRRPEDNPPEAEFLFSTVKYPRSSVLCGLLWEEPRPVQRVEITWPKDAARRPRPQDVVLRWLPHGNSSSWWSRRPAGSGTLVFQTAQAPQVSLDGLTYSFVVDATRPETALDNLLVVVKNEVAQPATAFSVPTVRRLSPSPGR